MLRLCICIKLNWTLVYQICFGCSFALTMPINFARKNIWSGRGLITDQTAHKPIAIYFFRPICKSLHHKSKQDPGVVGACFIFIYFLGCFSIVVNYMKRKFPQSPEQKFLNYKYQFHECLSRWIFRPKQAQETTWRNAVNSNLAIFFWFESAYTIFFLFN